MLRIPFPHSTPEKEGIASAAVAQFATSLESQIQDVHSFILLRHGSVVANGWWSPYAPEYPHMLYSLSKSFTSTAVGIAVAEGFFSIDDPVLPFFADDAPAEVNTHLAAMRVRHLLSMTTGHDEDTWWHMTHCEDGNWIKAFFGVPVVHEPRTHFLYNTGASYMLSAIVQKTTGLKVVDFLKPRLFVPLGIEHHKWDESPQGINLGGIGLSTTTEAIARFGQLHLQKGMWQGQQLIPEEWVEEATAFQVANGEGDYSDWTQGYGYQFWRCRHGAYRGDGAFGQYCVVMPEQDAVLAITGGMALEDMQQPLDFLWEHLLPAMGSEPLDEAVEDQQRLAEKLSSLSLPAVKGNATSSVVSDVSGQTYNVDENVLHIETLCLSLGESGWLRLTTADVEEIIECGYGVWRQSQTRLFNQGNDVEPHSVFASGAWMGDDSFTLVVRLVETPFYHTLVFYFGDDDLMVEMGINLSLESAQKVLLTAQK